MGDPNRAILPKHPATKAALELLLGIAVVCGATEGLSSAASAAVSQDVNHELQSGSLPGQLLHEVDGCDNGHILTDPIEIARPWGPFVVRKLIGFENDGSNEQPRAHEFDVYDCTSLRVANPNDPASPFSAQAVYVEVTLQQGTPTATAFDAVTGQPLLDNSGHSLEIGVVESTTHK